MSRSFGLVISPFVEWTTLVGIMDNDCFVVPKETCNSSETNDCILPKLRRNLVGYRPFCFPLDTGDTHPLLELGISRKCHILRPSST